MIQQLSRLPGIGEKSAQRLAFFLLSLPKEAVQSFTSCISDTRNRIKYCQNCYNISVEDTCFICKNTERDKSQLCVVAEPKDIYAIETTVNKRYSCNNCDDQFFFPKIIEC